MNHCGRHLCKTQVAHDMLLAETEPIVITSIISAGVVIMTAMIKFVPRKHSNGKGDLLAKAVDVVEIKGRLTVLENATVKESEYTHRSMHTIRDNLHNLQLKQALMDQKLDDICDKLRIKRTLNPRHDVESP
jgi:hypothetical protein